MIKGRDMRGPKEKLVPCEKFLKPLEFIKIIMMILGVLGFD